MFRNGSIVKVWPRTVAGQICWTSTGWVPRPGRSRPLAVWKDLPLTYGIRGVDNSLDANPPTADRMSGDTYHMPGRYTASIRGLMYSVS